MSLYEKTLLLVTVVLLIAVQEGSAQTGNGGDPNAVTNNRDRVAAARCRQQMRGPICGNAANSQSGILGFDYTEISPERNTTDFSWSNTVSVRELSETVQKSSSLLQKQALRALDRGDNLDAEHLLRRALELTPSAGAIYNNLGVSFLRRDKIEETASWFEKAVRVAPYDPLLLGNLGIIRWVQLRSEESYQLIDRAVSDGFSTPTAHYILGVMSTAKGEVDNGIRELRKSDPDRYPMRDLYLSIALNIKGNSKAASKSYNGYIANIRVPLSMVYVPCPISTHSPYPARTLNP